MSDSAPVIDVRGLVKSFGSTRALDGLDLTVEKGEVHGFLGPNGAGKTTTLRVLLGSVRADGGTATVLGLDPWRDIPALHAKLAYVPGDVALWPNLTGGEVIDLLGRLQGGHDAIKSADPTCIAVGPSVGANPGDPGGWVALLQPPLAMGRCLDAWDWHTYPAPRNRRTRSVPAVMFPH